MLRWVVGIVASLLFTAGAVLIARDQAPEPSPLSGAADSPAAVGTAIAVDEAATRILPTIPQIEEPPAADPISKEEKRFNRKDKNGDEIIDLPEMVHSRRTRFANLDLDGNGELRFEEWAITTIDKFSEADADGDGMLTRAEYATTAPKPRKKKPACSC